MRFSHLLLVTLVTLAAYTVVADDELTCPVPPDDLTGSCSPLSSDSEWAQQEGVDGLGSCGKTILNGAKCSLSCGQGYQLDGNQFLCSNGVLQNLGQHCVVDSAYDTGCPAMTDEQLAAISAGALAGTCGTFVPETGSCSIDCKTGFLFNGEAEFTCVNGQYVNNGQTCVDQCPTPPPTGSQEQPDCEAPPSPDLTGSCAPWSADNEWANTEGVAGLGSCALRTQNGKTCSLNCGLGYQADGNQFLCNNGVWENLGQHCIADHSYDEGLGCEALTTEYVSTIEGAYIGSCVTSIADASTCTLSCAEGYTLTGNPFTCSKGTLTNNGQTCVRNCPDTGSQEQPVPTEDKCAAVLCEVNTNCVDGVCVPIDTGSSVPDTGSEVQCVCPPVNTCPETGSQVQPITDQNFPNTPASAISTSTSTSTTTDGDSTTTCTTTTRAVENICKHYTLAMFGLDGSCFETALSSQFAMRLLYGCASCAPAVQGIFSADSPIVAAIQANQAWTVITNDTAEAEQAFGEIVKFVGSALQCQSEGFPSIDVGELSDVVAEWRSHVVVTQVEIDYIIAQATLVLQSYNIPAADQILIAQAAQAAIAALNPDQGSQVGSSDNTGSTGSSDNTGSTGSSDNSSGSE